MKKVLVINGPNINVLEHREKDVYGGLSLKEIIDHTEHKLKGLPVEIEWFQSNVEGEIINKIQEVLTKKFDALVINPAAYSHTSMAILDALKVLKCKVVEVHISNTHKRDLMRQRKLTARASDIIIEGAGKHVYFLAIYALLLDIEEV